MMKNKLKKGFTLIEMLIVVAIIGILASVILISTSTARAKARDAKRTLDIGELRTALLLYFDANKRYPTLDEFGTAPATPVTNAVYLAPIYIPQVPTDPLTKQKYKYVAIKSPTASASTRCLAYHLGASMEALSAGSGVLDSDDDLPVSAQAVCSTMKDPNNPSADISLPGVPGVPFNGLNCIDNDSILTDKTQDTCYDIYQNQ